VCVGLYGLDADQRKCAACVPERAGDCGHQRPPTGNPDGLRPGDAQVTPCLKRPPKQEVTLTWPWNPLEDQ
jgi:hypothetical protein